MEHICYTCGITCDKKDYFHIMDSKFCSMNCLRPFRQKLVDEEAERRKNDDEKSFRKFDCGGAYAH